MISLQLLFYLPEIIGIILIILLIALSRSSAGRSRQLIWPMILMALWLIFQLLAQTSANQDTGLIFVRASIVTSAVMALAYYFAIRVYIDKPIRTLFSVFASLGALFIVLIGMDSTTIEQTTSNLSGISIDKASNWYYVILLYTLGIFAYALVELFIATKKLTKNLRTRNYVLFISSVQVIALSGLGSVLFAQVAAAQVLIFLSALVFCIGIFFGIFKHKLFDVRLIVARSVGYSLSILTLALVYFLIAYVLSLVFFKGGVTSGVSLSPVNIILALILAFVFQPVKRFFDKITNFLFYRDEYNTEEFFARLTRKLSTMTDLMTLLTYASTEISKTLKASHGAFLIYREEASAIYISDERRRKMPTQDMAELDTYVKLNGDNAILAYFLEGKSQYGLKRMLMSHKIALVLPIMKEKEITGYLFLGEHLSTRYTPRDIRALETIADELSIAIQNALSIQAVKDLNATLQQRIDIATKELRATNAQLHRLDEAKDEFMSMASHQLRTPLTSVKGYISMVLEGDAGKVTTNQQQLLNEAYTSSERMVHLINDFLNVSRIQTGKFVIDKTVVDLSKIVFEELNSLKSSADRRGMKFKYNEPKNFPMLEIDEGKIRQVIMNYCDNAIYYSKEGTDIKVDLSVDDKDVLFTVKDTGIGVPEEERAHLFTKFFRAANARKQRPDGTGVGIFLAKKVVVAHGGDIVFESVLNKGSTFGFTLPLSKLRPSSDVN